MKTFLYLYNMTKTEFHNTIIDITRKLGQGLSGIVIYYKPELQEYADELIEEGKIRKQIQRYSHLPADIWYMPTNCYDVWQDTDNGEQRALFFVRLYLGEKDLGLGCTPKQALSNVEVMENYVTWLKRNEKMLENMVNLENVEDTSEEIVLSEEDIDFIKSRSWYDKKTTIKDCLISSRSFSTTEEEGLRKRLLELYRSDEEKYAQEIFENEEWFDALPKSKRMRKKINKWLEMQKETDYIQEII